MILFAILCRLIEKLPGNDLFVGVPLIKCILAALTEQTTGLAALSRLTFYGSRITSEIKIILAAIFTCFGGLAAAAQTYGLIRGHGLSLKTYIGGKAAHGALAGLTAAFLINIL